MRLVSVLFAAAAAALMACNGGQPTTFRVAIDESPRLALPPTCYANNELPAASTRHTLTNLRGEYDWIVWDGIDGKQYMSLGAVDFPLGDAAPIQLGSNEVIEGTEGLFVGTRTSTRLPDPNNNNYSNVRTRTVTVSWDNMGTSPTGTLDLVSNYTCTSCAPGETEQPGNKNCSTRMTWSGRRIDLERVAGHAN